MEGLKYHIHELAMPGYSTCMLRHGVLTRGSKGCSGHNATNEVSSHSHHGKKEPLLHIK